VTSADGFLAQLERTAQRIRSMSTSQLERDSRIEKIRELLTRMAAISRPGITVPALATTALGDQLLVIGREFSLHGATVDIEILSQELLELRKTL
jgi:hypothetical protein